MTAYLGLGSNLGDRRAQLQAAVDALAGVGVAVTASSAVYETDPVGDVVEQPAFLNACVQVETRLAPDELLAACKQVERTMGRVTDPADPAYVRHGPRPVDIDILLLDEAVVADGGRLVVPHPGILHRRFVLVPLLELDLGLATPDGRLLADALAALPVDEGVRRHGPPLDGTVERRG